MQAIITKYLCPTNTKGSRIKATCERGSVTIHMPHEMSVGEAHVWAADVLVAKFVKEDAVRYGTKKNPWGRPRVAGCLPTGEYAHVFLPMKGGAS